MSESEIWITLSLMVLCLIAEGFFSGSELGVVSADRMKLRHDAAKGSRGARLALEMLEKRPEWLLSTTLVGTNIAVVTNSTIATALMISLFGEAGSWLAVILVAPLIWVFGEIVPKSVFQQRADTITPYVIYVLRFFSILFWPILVVFVTLSKFLSRLAGSRDEHNPFTLREQIQSMVQMPPQEGGDIQPIEKTMIRRMFNFSETTVYNVMVPLIDVNAVEKHVTVGEAVRLAVESSHIRLPVYDGRIDRVVGVLNTMDLLGMDESSSIEPFIRPTRYVPASKSAESMLVELRKDGDAMAVVMDEFGGAEGIVTIEDIIEDVVEDMQDEYDRQEKPAEWLKKLGHHDYLVSARADPGMLVEKLGLKLPGNGNYDTLSGFLLEHAREIPRPGTTLEVEGIKFTIQRATPQVIQEVQVRW
ncbi:MAG: HlyC/CorC family transporter [Candidatus Accumulibacter sp.]|jgi:putative hemolysin|uniref:hemolysin family protein n=1 Tax=Candidatus Accumulibacter TaxID=327159 RepID=UPI001AC07364|nr:hemolysin family protein [Accumulibacter sp.]MBK8116012.1 HlyC/CorC family transporter [Accumulibacter sp.]MBK8385950.1 HlyC/CorC family transporter [Accumulibacter sp.]MBK8579243.1 HlyC/CorC family transporter [Candidatus Accumulibacter propinquus]MBN8438023.1 HlyC/CorC family transporter [Accumulibacter sp.]